MCARRHRPGFPAHDLHQTPTLVIANLTNPQAPATPWAMQG